MQFRTEIKLGAAPFQIDHQQKILGLGSCFAVNIGEKLRQHKFNVLLNPFGTLFNPLSSNKLLQVSLEESDEIEASLFEFNQLWQSFLVGKILSHPNQHTATEQVKKIRNQASEFIKKTDVLVLTWGTAWAFRHKKSGEFVANCHKVPGSEFERKLLSTAEIVYSSEQIFERLFAHNPELRILITVSPIRHIKEGLADNNLSKSVLRVASHEVSQKFPRVHYFPAYEMLIDDLRGYRFYEMDLIHPNEHAIEYVWQHFSTHFFATETIELIAEWTKIQRDFNHSPFNPQADAYKVFLEKLHEKLIKMNTQLDCGWELSRVKEKLREY